MSAVAIIPARGGSKRIHRKNLKDFLGIPIISYSIETALKSSLFEEVIVSTEDEEIADFAIKMGAHVPFLRSKENANNFASTSDVLEEVLNKLDIEYKYACCLYPTAPFVTQDILSKAYQILQKQEFDTVFPIVQYSYPIQRSLKVIDNQVSMVWPDNILKRSQDLEPRFHDVGQFYWLTVRRFLKNLKLFTKNSGYVIIDELNAQDIDNETDWKLAEIKYQLMHGQKKDNI